MFINFNLSHFSIHEGIKYSTQGVFTRHTLGHLDGQTVFGVDVVKVCDWQQADYEGAPMNRALDLFSVGPLDDRKTMRRKICNRIHSTNGNVLPTTILKSAYSARREGGSLKQMEREKENNQLIFPGSCVTESEMGGSALREWGGSRVSCVYVRKARIGRLISCIKGDKESAS